MTQTSFSIKFTIFNTKECIYQDLVLRSKKATVMPSANRNTEWDQGLYCTNQNNCSVLLVLTKSPWSVKGSDTTGHFLKCKCLLTVVYPHISIKEELHALSFIYQFHLFWQLFPTLVHIFPG